MIGCSSFTLTSKDNKHLLSRTMDFGIEMAEQVVFVPRNKTFDLTYTTSDSTTSKFAFIGMGQILNNSPILFDGINEKGLMGATLYFPGYATYKDTAADETLAISPDKVIPYILSQATTVEDVKTQLLESITLINDTNPIISKLPPLHFIFSDKTGASIIVEPMPNGLNIIEDSIGVMTNSPDYSWHETNLRNYITVTPHQHEPITLANKELSAFSQGSGTFGLPGDYTPPARFVRVAYLRNFSKQPENEIEAVSLSHHILESVSIPNGVVIDPQGEPDYTCYSSYMCAESLSFYFAVYSNQRLQKITLNDELIASTEYKEFKVQTEEDINCLN
ncbi:penicillin acylase [Brochothrix thermosphacta]|uniref:choloylglycine hydrolase family protein n=1 Tax=Brochothrix thermosphacta TaxID=2756 RepID=UPI000E7565FD|nr:choloylglycine hydrolase family protein [Brochothrix thermosphacta]ANZ93987.1 penicillin acylase [Brochothrix thermosphacta]